MGNELNKHRLICSEFLVLEFAGHFVDENNLHNGIYITELPRLHKKGTTIEMMITLGRGMVDMVGNNFIKESYFENLSKCKLSEIKISRG